MIYKGWSNLAQVVTRRTYLRDLESQGRKETWWETVDRYSHGNTNGKLLYPGELDELIQLGRTRKGFPAGRGIWASGSATHGRLGGAALNNCWFLTCNDWSVYSTAMDLLMLGGGVGMSVEAEQVNQLPRVRKDVKIVRADGPAADLVVEDTREGWVNLLHEALQSYFVTGRSFSYSTHRIRAEGEPIRGFGGKASGPEPLVQFIKDLCILLDTFAGEKISTVAAGDILCMTGQMVKSGNVRRSALILIGDPWDEAYLKAKRWDLGQIPIYRASANYSVYASSAEQLSPAFWETYENGEPFGIVNRENIQKYGRMGELRPDGAMGVNPCAEATLMPYEPCNLVENALPNLTSVEEFERSARLLFRYAKRVTLENYHISQVDEVIKQNRRVGVGITGCLQSPLYSRDVLDHVYKAIQREDEEYSRQLGVPKSIKTTVIKPSGTVSKMADCAGEGIHPGFSRYLIQRVRIAANDPLIPMLREAGHYMEPVKNFDGSEDCKTMVVDFYVESPTDLPVADESWDTWKQLEVLKFAQKHWADQAVSVTVYYYKHELPKIKEWLASNLSELKTISFLCHNDHGFIQAPKETISKEQYETLSAGIRPMSDFVDESLQLEIDSQECAGGVCPIK
jgi:ribonucleoside-triphosphate reductase